MRRIAAYLHEVIHHGGVQIDPVEAKVRVAIDPTELGNDAHCCHKRPHNNISQHPLHIYEFNTPPGQTAECFCSL